MRYVEVLTKEFMKTNGINVQLRHIAAQYDCMVNEKLL